MQSAFPLRRVRASQNLTFCAGMSSWFVTHKFIVSGVYPCLHNNKVLFKIPLSPSLNLFIRHSLMIILLAAALHFYRTVRGPNRLSHSHCHSHTLYIGIWLSNSLAFSRYTLCHAWRHVTHVIHGQVICELIYFSKRVKTLKSNN